MKILIIVFGLAFVELSVAQETVKWWFIPANCSDGFYSFAGQPYNSRDGVSYRVMPVEDLPLEYKEGIFVEISHPEDQLIERSVQANIVGIYEKCTRNSSFSLSSEEFDLQVAKELVEEFGGDGDSLSIDISGEDVTVYFRRK